ncbi:GIY-YIG nuclease family protein [Paracoccaceae bacterium]|nr:GIY-YIG nuclease family protein [Paracoccaceae bacterium]
MAGFVYIMSNPLFDRIKIGKSTKDPTKDRLDELNRETGTPEKYKCEYYAFVGDEHGLELAMHRQFSDRRPNARREFFEVGISEVITAIRNTATNFGGMKYEEIHYDDLKTVSFEHGFIYNAEMRIHLKPPEYVGEWKDGQKHGQGTETWPNGDQYVGEWKDGKENGQGTQTWPDGDQYVGEFKDGQKHGQGTLTFADGDQYVGGWKDGQLPDD